MFTGIISSIGTIEARTQRGDLRLRIACAWDDFTMGESIACSGACLTVVEYGGGHFSVDLSSETLARTAPGMWEKGRKLNLERALKMGDALDGHLVTGHVDGVAKLISVTETGGSHELCFEAPAALSRFIAEKGSVTLDGVSLTVNKVDGTKFHVNIIPHTWENTTLGLLQSGDSVNLEIDLIARYVARLLGK